MPGEEIIPAKAAAAAAKAAIRDKKGTTRQLAELAKDSPAMKAAAESYARRLAIKQATLLKLYRPLAKWAGASEEYFRGEFAEDMAAKISDIPEENLTAPPPSVAVPAMQGLAYSLEEPNLKDMYLTLLATATDDRSRDAAHPSFAEIIKQLSPSEAHLLRETLDIAALPIVQLRRKAPSGEGGTLHLNHLLQLVETETGDTTDDPSIAVWVDNWIRLGLIEVDYSRKLVAGGIYDWVETHPARVRLIESDERGRDAVEVIQGRLRPTDFGRTFASAVTSQLKGDS